ncbi:MAG TPA: DNA polymerase II large subunit [Candidatus Acidoferrales bacterium]|nr:DNA polymerase II large subunit [Candidatus Acidoferrales bacterium]
MDATALSQHDQYFQRLKDQFDTIYDVARQARAKGFDPANTPESLVTHDVAERVEKAVGPPGAASRIRELSLLMPRELVALKMAEEISLSKFGMEGERAAEQAVRTASAILDEGVTAAPIEGISSVRIRSNQDGSKYLAVYFAGPIRSAGGTDMALILVIADYVRHHIGLGRYKATELEAKRFVEELRLYEREVARFQFKVSDEELFNAIMRLPVEVNGVETDPVEVSAYRNVPRVDTNRVRGGALRVVHDGLIGRSHKVLKIVGSLSIDGWNWLREIKPPVAEAEEAREFMFMEDVLAGRPIFSFPQFPGGFRLRYGRARNTGLAAIGLHPSTMLVLGKFIAVGTQLRLEKPGKAGIAATVNSIEPPVVRLKNGDVLRLSDSAAAERLLDSIERILFLGDILIGYGEFLENNRPLLPSGFVEEWWRELLEYESTHYSSLTELANQVGLSEAMLSQFLDRLTEKGPTAEEAVQIAKRSNVPLHPRYTWFWENITVQDYDYLRSRLLDAKVSNVSLARVTTKKDQATKNILENLCVPHKVADDLLVVDQDTPALYESLGLSSPGIAADGKDVFEKILHVSRMRVMKKAPVYVGARMGRPEKAKRREMKPVVHCLFPIGLSGGARRNIIEATSEKTVISLEVAYRKCKSCGNVTHLNSCEKCGNTTEITYTCPKCGIDTPDKICASCKGNTQAYNQRSVPVRDMLASAEKRLGLAVVPESLKGVRGLTNDMRVPEPLEKGLLRAKYDISMFKDGTVRFDATNAPLTHFRPTEIGVGVGKVRELGYVLDIFGKPLESPEQCCSLRVHDVIVPEECGEYFVRVARFLDDLLEGLYGLPRFYKIKSREDVVGSLVVGLSPHTSVGVIGRIIGYTKASVIFAHPFWHAAKRRDCDGDEDSVSLALDILLNFSKKFLPSRIGGIMDAPILLTIGIKPREIARQAFNLETVQCLPLRFFEETQRATDPKALTKVIETVQDRLGSQAVLESLGFTQEISDIGSGNLQSAYKQLGSMIDKVTLQLKLAEEVKAVEAGEVAKRVLSTHFMRDLTGNLKAFAGQRFRCTNCNAKFRRVPLKGTCSRCGGKLSLTVYRGSVEKYLTVAQDLVKRYDLGKYHEQRLVLLHEEINSIFSEHEEKKKQPTLAQFV